MRITRRAALAGASTLALPGLARAQAPKPLKIGVIVPMTGPFTAVGRHIEAGMRLYLRQKGDVVAGRKLELVVKDDTGVADVTKRIATEMLTGEGVEILTGFGLTPLALAVAPIATQAKAAQLVMMAATPVVTERSPFILRPAFTTAQTTVPIADWCVQTGVKKVVTLVSDYAPGIDIENTFVERFKGAGGEVAASLRVPLASRDFAPFLQRAADAKPDALFVFVPAGVGAALIKQYVERGLDKAGIKIIGEGSVTEDDIITQMDDSVIGMVTSHHYSAAHDSPENKAFVAEYKAANKGVRPNLIAVHAYDGMHMIHEGLKKTGGDAAGEKLVEAMKGLSWTSPRGPVTVDPETRELIQNIYMRRVEKRDGELWNIEFATIPNVKDPAKIKK